MAIERSLVWFVKTKESELDGELNRFDRFNSLETPAKLEVIKSQVRLRELPLRVNMNMLQRLGDEW